MHDSLVNRNRTRKPSFINWLLINGGNDGQPNWNLNVKPSNKRLLKKVKRLENSQATPFLHLDLENVFLKL